METLTGNLLVASSLMDDPVLARGVCLLVHDDEEAVIGVMLNRPMLPNPKALMSMLSHLSGQLDDDEASPSSDSTENRLGSVTKSQHHSFSPMPDQYSPAGLVHFGGPLSGPIVAIHQLSEYAEAETGHGIYVAAQKQHLEGLVKKQPGPYRLIIGHLGWEPARLQGEMDAGLWHLVPATAEAVFENSDQMWPRLIRRATSRSVARWVGIEDQAGSAELN
ncbi:hypothetical protein CA13_41350 [Planctomycetes bacterium CA13]|uniref:Uncharacterized protein n=1 Tax=Novipirellula herctigrandis TaxID=2527986 RepID=A0A5C5Z5T5_9BACT|nr:hypothetical protein CA13_41350 [Planctomycetes bacterium CA13]